MKKYILLLLFFTSFLQAQTFPTNPTPFGKISLNTNTESTTATKINVQEDNKQVNWMQPINIPITVVPNNYTPTAQTIGGHLAGLDNKIGTIVQTTAGTFARVFFTGVTAVVNSVTYYTSSTTGKGAVASVNQTVSNNDDTRTYFSQDVISTAQLTATTSAPGIYSGQLTVRVSDDSAQEKFGFEVYKTNNLGVPIASGITGAPVGSLGVTVVAILDSGVIDLVQNATTNVTVSGQLLSQLSLNVGERIRYHAFAEKVGTAGASFTYTLYYGSNHNSYYDIPVTPKTSTVINDSGVVGVTASDALNNLDQNKISTLSNINSMVSYSGPATTVIVSEKNRGGTFIYKTGSFTNDNGVIFTATGKGSGYWERQYTGAHINVQWFPNIVADGISDCATGINAIPNKYTYRYFPAGQYLLNSTINISGDLTYWSFMGDDTPMKTENKGTVFLANFSGNVFDTGTSYSYEGIQFKNFQIWHVAGGYGIRSGWPETRIENVRMLLEYGNGVNIAFVSGSNGAFDCTLLDVKIEGRFTDTPVTYSGTGLYIDSGSNNLLFANSFLYGFSNAIIIKSSENVNIIQNNLNANGGDYAIKVLDNAGTINLNIQNNYIESQNRALYVGQAKGVHLVNNIINDAGFGGSDNLSDAHLYFDINTTSVSLIGNTITSSFQNQSFVYSPNDITLSDNYFTRNRPSSTFLGNNFDVPFSSWQRDILNTITSGSVVTNVRRLQGQTGSFSGNVSTGGATPNTYPLLVRAATNANFRVSKLGTYPQLAFLDDTDSNFVAFSLGGNWQTFSSLGAVNFSSLAGTGTRQVVADASGNLSATDIAPTSGTYTPTITNISNTSTFSLSNATYTRVGNIVTVCVGLNFTATATGTCKFKITLPIIRTVTTSGNPGTFSPTTQLGVPVAGTIQLNTTNNEAECTVVTTGSSNFIGSAIFQYSVN